MQALYNYMYWTGICNFIFKASLVKDLRFNEKLWIGEDTIFKFQLYKNLSNFSCVRKVLYHYRKHSRSCTGGLYSDLPSIIYKRYHILEKIIQDGGYPDNAELVINSIELIRQLPFVIEVAFNGKMSFKCDYDLIKNYINTNEFRSASLNYNKMMVGKSANYYLLFGKPNRLVITIVYMLKKLKEGVLSKEKF